MMARTILYIGNFMHDHCTEQAYAYGFRAHGQNVIGVQQEQAHQEGPDLIRELVARTRPWLVLYTRTHNTSALGRDRHGPTGWEALWKELERDDVATASVHLDVFRGLPRREELVTQRDPMFTMGTVFTADGDPASQIWYEYEGVNHVWLPPGYDNRTIAWPTGELTERAIATAHDKIVFVGSTAGYPHPHRAKLINHLLERWHAQTLMVGPHTGYGTVRGVPLDVLIGNAAVVVGDSCFAGERANYWSDRVPETLGRGGNLLHTYVDGIEDWYNDNDPDHPDVITYYNAGDMALLDEQLGYLLREDGVTRARRGAAARELVAERDTYTHRAATIIATLLGGTDD